MVVIGLGNPGPEYEKTRHNVGFLTLERIAELKGVRLKKRLLKPYRLASFSSHTLVEPLTYMNNSGRVIPHLVKADDKVIIIVDQMDLPPGKIRIRTKGGSAGHNGLKSVIENYGEVFIRVYIGVGRPAEGVSVVEHVLTEFSESDQLLVNKAVQEAAERVIDILNGERFELVVQRANSFQA